MIIYDDKDKTRFWKFVEKRGKNECWEWVGGTTPSGYGRFWLNGKNISATHFAIGVEVPSGMVVCHKCDNPKCVNPLHLFLGTYKDNMDDMRIKGRMVTKRVVRKNYKRGEGHYLSKLTQEQVKQIRQMHIPRKFGADRIAKLFGVTDSTIKKILKRDTWRHI